MIFRKLHRTVKLRLFEQMLARMASNMVMPFMIVYFAQQWGAVWAGLAMAGQALAATVSNLYGGYVADRLGRRFVMLIGEYARFCAYVVMSLALSPWFHVPFLAFFMLLIVGVSSGLSKPAGQAMLIDVSTEENRKLIFSFDYWSNNITMLAGSMLGGFLFKNHRFALMVSLAGTSLLSLTFLQFLIFETMEKIKKESVQKRNIFVEIWQNYKIVVRDILFCTFMIASLLDMSIETQASNYLAVRLVQDVGAHTLISIRNFSFSIDGYKLYSLLYSVNTVTVLVFGVIVSSLIKRFKDRTVLYAGMLVYLMGYGYLTLGKQPLAMLGVMVLITLGELGYVTIKQSVLAEITPQDNRSSYMAVNNLSYRVSTLIAPLSVSIGVVLPRWGMSIFYIALGLVAIVFYRRVFTRHQLNKQGGVRIGA